MTRSRLTRCAAFALGTALAVAGFAIPVRADVDAPVVVIMLENHSYGATDPGVKNNTKKYIVGNTADAPYINNTLIPSGTLFTNYDANVQTSLPDYLEYTAGTTGGCATGSCARDSLPNENLFHLLGQAGITFASIQESMPKNCALNNSGTYLVGHNPEIYYTDVDAKTNLPYDCPVTDIAVPAASSPGTPVAWPNPLPAFSHITPNYCDEMHGSPAAGICPSGTDALIAAGDAWLATNVPALLAEGAIVIVTFDEGGGGDSTHGGGHVPTIMVGPGVSAGATDPTLYDHASLLGGLEGYFGLTPLLGDAATATPLPIPHSSQPAPTISGLAPESGAPGDQVTIAGTGFSNAFAVRFAGTSAAFSVGSDTSITATVPVGAVTGPVTVSTTRGTATSPDTFTVLGPPPPSLIQHAAASGTKSTAAAVTWPLTTAAGDLQVATLGWWGTANVTPPAGWSLAVSSGSTAVYYRQNAPASSGPVTFTMSAKVSWVLSISEWSGIATSGALDRTAHATSGSGTATSGASGTTTAIANPVELVVAGIRAVGVVAESSPTNGFAQLDQQVAGTNTALGAFDRVTTTAGTQSTSVTLSPAAEWRGAIATFRSA
jgi:Phosphoesterase family/IPT/TIG domain